MLEKKIMKSWFKAYINAFNICLFILGTLVILYNTKTGTYDASKSLQIYDAKYVKLRGEIGELTGSMVIGGSWDTLALDMVVNHQGIFVLLKYYPGIFPHPASKKWAGYEGSTGNNSRNEIDLKVII